MLEMFQDGVEVYTLPDNNFCLADEYHKSPLELEECPIGCRYCTGDCYYYSEDPDNRLEQEDDWI